MEAWRYRGTVVPQNAYSQPHLRFDQDHLTAVLLFQTTHCASSVHPLKLKEAGTVAYATSPLISIMPNNKLRGPKSLQPYHQLE